MDDGHLARIEREAGAPGLGDALTRLSASDLRSLLLDVFERRGAALELSDVLRVYEADRFSRPSGADPAALLEIDRRAFALLPDWERVELSPLAPFGTCSVLGRMSQSRVVSAVRGEVAADPTNALALEAAVRRRRDRSTPVRLCASQRVVRGQQFEPPDNQHFRLFALVSANRAGSEDEMLAEHVGFYTRLLDGIGDVTTCPPEGAYYERTHLEAHIDGVAVADGGFVDWTQRLLGDAKERLLISGIGTERLLGSGA